MSKEKIGKLFENLREAGFLAKENYCCCQGCAWAAAAEEVGDQHKGIVFYHNQDAEGAFGTSCAQCNDTGTVECDECDGYGKAEANDDGQCDECGGDGEFPCGCDDTEVGEEMIDDLYLAFGVTEKEGSLGSAVEVGKVVKARAEDLGLGVDWDESAGMRVKILCGESE